jgi:ankyrin repeat protein
MGCTSSKETNIYSNNRNLADKIISCAINGNVEELNRWIKLKAPLNYKVKRGDDYYPNCNYGLTAMQCAVKYKNFNCVKILVDAGANLDKKQKWRHSF